MRFFLAVQLRPMCRVLSFEFLLLPQLQWQSECFIAGATSVTAFIMKVMMKIDFTTVLFQFAYNQIRSSDR